MSGFLHRALVCGVAALGLATPAEAAIRRVPTDFVTLFQAIFESAPGDTVQVVGNGGATFHHAQLTFDKDLTIQGGWRADFAVRDPEVYVTVVRDTTNLYNKALFLVEGSPRLVFDGIQIIGGQIGIRSEGGADITLRDCTIRSQRNGAVPNTPIGPAGGGIRMVGGTLRIENTRIQNIVTRTEGAGMVLDGVSSFSATGLQLDNVTAARLTGGSNGGGIWASGVQDILIENSTLESCSSVADGGLLFVTGGPALLRGCTLRNGLASSDGGALALVEAGDVTLENCVMEGNRGFFGGGIRADDSSLLTLRGCRIAENVAPNEGAGLYLHRTPFEFENCEFEANIRLITPQTIVAEGASARVIECDGSVTGTTFTNERSSGRGGSWSQIGGLVSFDGCRFENCESGVFGGAIQIELGGEIQVRNSLFHGNRSKFGGSIATSFTATVNIDRSTFVGDIAGSGGASVYLDTAAIVRFTNSLACLATRGDVIYCSAATLEVDHSNVWNDDAVNQREEYGGACGDPTGTNGNLAVNPGFCVPAAPDWRLSASSPLVGAAADGGDIGWSGVGCPAADPLSLEPTSWGRLKASFRQGER